MSTRSPRVLGLAVLLALHPSVLEARAAPAEILARAKEAAGGAAWDAVSNSHFIARVSTASLEGTAEGWDDVLTGRYLETYALGPITGGGGFDGETAWSRDGSGQIRPEEGEDGRLGTANEAYRRCLAHWYPERWPAEMEYVGEEQEDDGRFHVIRIVPRGGRPYDVWIDAGTWLTDRIVEEAALETRTFFYSDYRNVEGVKVPFASRFTNGETRYDEFVTLESIEFDLELKPGHFDVPAPPPADFVIAGGETSTQIPFELLNNHIYVDIGLNGQGPFRLLFDSGGANIVTPTVAARLGLKPEGAAQGRGVGEESEDVGFLRMETVNLGDITIMDQLFRSLPLESFGDVEGVPFLGIVGYEVLKRFVVKIDYEHHLITLTVPSAFDYKGSGTVVAFQFDGHAPQVAGSIDGTPGTFTIDTGSRGSVSLLGPFVEEHDLETHFAPRVECVDGWGVGGAVRSQVARAEVLRLGDVEVRRPVTTLSLQKKGSFADPYVAGNVGAGVLSRFNLTFDYDNQHIVFEPNANFSRPDVFDRSGMWLNVVGRDFEIMDAPEGGAAAAAGLQVGDRVVAVDGQSVEEMSLPALRLRFKTDPAGTKIQLRVLRDGDPRAVTLVLREMV